MRRTSKDTAGESFESRSNLIVHVETTPATTTDYEMTPEIHAHLTERNLLPGEYLLDKEYMSSDNLVKGQKTGY